jgi:O-antigen ligase
MYVHARMRDESRRDFRGVLLMLSDAGPLTICGLVAVMVLTLAATLSRSGFLGLIAAALAGASLSRGDRKRIFWVGVAAAVALVAGAAWLNLEGLTQRVVTTVSGSEIDATGRLTIWRETLRIVRDFPLLGTGVGTFADTMFVYQQTARDVLFNNAHNEYLQLLTEGGVPLLMLGIAGGVLLARAARTRLAADLGAHQFLRVGACSALTGVAVQSLWEAGLRAPANLLLAAIVAAIAIRPIDRSTRSTEIAPT